MDTNTNAAASNGSRKRPMSLNEGNRKLKRTDGGAKPEDPEIQFKMLIPNGVAGVIIGKGGDKIRQLQEAHSVNIKTSKPNDYYPGTTERVCCIKGKISSITDVLEFIVTEGYSKIGSSDVRQPYDVKDQTRDAQIKVLVTNASAGVIIGQGGSTIKDIKESTGAFVRVAKKSENMALQERVVTIAADSKEVLMMGAHMVMDCIADDAGNGSIANTSYSGINQNISDGVSSALSNIRSDLMSILGAETGGRDNKGGSFGMDRQQYQTLGDALGCGGNVAEFMGKLRFRMQNAGYTDFAITEVSLAIDTLCKHNVLGLNVGGSSGGGMGGGSFPSGGLENSYGSYYGGSFGNITMGGTGASSGGGGSSLEDRFGFKGVPKDNGQAEEASVNIPEKLVGLIMGKEAKTLKEIRALSGTQITVSPKGSYAPGTTDRIVTIEGGQNNVAAARKLIDMCIAEDNRQGSKS